MGLFSAIGDAFSNTGDFINNKFLGGDQARAAQGAAGIQQQAAGAANNELGAQFANSNSGYQPYQQGGQNAFQQLNQGWQGGQYNPGTLRGMSAQNYNAGAAPQAYQLQQFDPSKLQNDPGYQFQLNQGMNAVQNSAAAKGMLHSGNTLSGINSMAQGLANTTLNDAFSRYATQQNQGMQQGQNQFQNWQGAANFGQGQAQNAQNFDYQSMLNSYNSQAQNGLNQFNMGNILGNYGMNAQNSAANLGMNYSQQYGNNLTGGANAQAAGMVGAANARTQGINNLMNLGGQAFGAIMARPSSNAGTGAGAGASSNAEYMY